MTSSKILFFLCLSFVAGIFLESLIKIPQIFLWAFLFLAILTIFFAVIARSETTKQSREYRLPRRLLAPRNDEILIAGFCILFLVIGILRVQITEFNIANDKLSKLNNDGKIYALTGVINNEPDVRDTFQKLKVEVNGSAILITTNRYPEYKYLDKIKLTGNLNEPGMFDESIFSQSYKNYLMKDGIYSVMNFPKIEIMKNRDLKNRDLKNRDRVSIFLYAYEKILFSKQKIRQSIQSNFSPPQSSILEGTILGDNGAMTNDLKTKLNITGLRHIIAVSGTHVVILSNIIMYLLLFVGLYRGQAFYIVITIIFLYVVLTGFPASGIRAGVMGGLFLLSQQFGRQGSAIRIITLAGTVMLAINPLLLFYDVGFQLSFLAVLGLIYLEPIIKLFLKFIIKQENLAGIVSTTLAAQVFTLPILVFNFGNISFVSLITNILVSPIVESLMVLGFLTSLAGIFSNILGYILSVPCHFLLLYFSFIIDFFSQPWAMKTLSNVNWIWFFASYAIIFSATYFLNKKYSRVFL